MKKRTCNRSYEERFEAKVDRSGDCHRWTGAHTPAGYGDFKYEGRSRRAHVVALLLAGVDVPRGMTVDHVWARGCRHRDCVRVEHLEVVTHRTNTLRSDGPAAINARKTSCDRGHEYTPDNLVRHRDVQRDCRTCHNERQRVRYHQRKAAARHATAAA